MTRLKIAALTALISLGFGASAAAETCGAVETPCTVASGRYYAAAPADWDGEAPLGALLYFHGWASSGKNTLRNKGLRAVAAEHDLLLIAAEGADPPQDEKRSWAHVGSPSQLRDEQAYVKAVMADAKARWPLDETRLYVSGFSQGGSMAWDIACYQGQDYTGFAPMAGAFWDPLPETCPAGPVTLRHIHGTGDTVVPMTGRPIGSEWHQSDVMKSFAIWKAVDGCLAEPTAETQEGALSCQTWNGCDSGRSLELCLHPGGHLGPAEWVGEGIEWIEAVTLEEALGD